MSVKVYLYSKCSTCRNALRFLEKMKAVFTVKEITETPPSIPDLKKMLKHMNGDLKKLFNTSGNLYRELQLSEKLPNMTQDEALALLTSNGMLVKRPFLLGDGVGLLGFSEKKWEESMKTFALGVENEQV